MSETVATVDIGALLGNLGQRLRRLRARVGMAKRRRAWGDFHGAGHHADDLGQAMLEQRSTVGLDEMEADDDLVGGGTDLDARRVDAQRQQRSVRAIEAVLAR